MNKDDIEPLENLLEEVKDIDGFPIAEDEDILELSDPPYYTACPNPYINKFIEEYGTPYDSKDDDYERKPFVGDVSEGKNDSIYMLHSYPTKVPPKAIEEYINHYTHEKDIIFDGFCGSGMTGVAARRTNRYSIINDLSPLASFIGYNINTSIDTNKFKDIATQILREVKNELGWMYKTNHDNKKSNNLFKEQMKKGEIQYTVWSDVYICPYCKNEYVLWDNALDSKTGKYKDEYSCPYCDAEIKKTESERAKERIFDSLLGKKITKVKQKPVLINYSMNGKRYEKKPDESDIKLIEKINNNEIPYWVPTDQLPEGYNTQQPMKSHNFTHVHHFYTKRNLWILASIRDKINNVTEKRLKNYLLNWFTSSQSRLHKMNRYMKQHNRHVGPLSGTLYISPFQAEISPFYFLKLKLKKYEKTNIKSSKVVISNQSTTNLNNIDNNTVDYIFTDPPFGDNLMYSELNFIIERWLKINENNNKEAIINNTQNKDLYDYTYLMNETFKEMHRILKPNRWITIEFHNSKASVWNGIQEALNRAGFIIAQVSTLDKKKGTVKQLSNPGTVKNDLIINAYKPKKEFEEKFLKNAGEGMEVDFVEQQLEHLPVEANIERTEKMLYSKMLAHYVENGFKIKYNANNFYKLLHDNFTEIDGYWFLDEQVNDYNEWKRSLKLDEIEDIKEGNQVMFVMDENSALTWLNSFLDVPKEYGEIYTNYEQITTKTNDKIPELRELLDKNFIMENGKYRRPKTKEERAKIEKNREKDLKKAWQKLLDRAKNGKRKIKNVRKEALKYGFTKCYQEENYKDIVTVADRLYKSTLVSSGDILDFVDIARMKID